MHAEGAEQERRAAADRNAEMDKLADSFETATGHIVGDSPSAATEREAARR